ncbi:uncharacterized protein [Aristolochia californica]|uniref:uncharacterized protein n=1 Tax=Aristolochia californica TaxID=171875 RepID=UPI0035D55948
MVDIPTVCCMCGDIGFRDKLFRCNKCQYRFQHSYCSNYNDQGSMAAVCDWCQSEERSGTKHGGYSKRSAGKEAGISSRSEYSGDRIKQHEREETSNDRGKNMSGTPSPRPAGRRYKLLKDVLC